MVFFPGYPMNVFYLQLNRAACCLSLSFFFSVSSCNISLCPCLFWSYCSLFPSSCRMSVLCLHKSTSEVHDVTCQMLGLHLTCPVCAFHLNLNQPRSAYMTIQKMTHISVI